MWLKQFFYLKKKNFFDISKLQTTSSSDDHQDVVDTGTRGRGQIMRFVRAADSGSIESKGISSSKPSGKLLGKLRIIIIFFCQNNKIFLFLNFFFFVIFEIKKVLVVDV